MLETFNWIKPSPLWAADGLDVRQPDFFQPVLLEFNSDDFVDEFLADARSADPAALSKTIIGDVSGQDVVKLFQPAHGAFYLTCSSLCCREPGFPDREISDADGESVFFVMRKLIGDSEYAWIVDQKKTGWQPVGPTARQVLANEERLPLHVTTAASGRTLLFGYIPVSSRETYAVPPATLDPATPTDSRVEELTSRFIDPINDHTFDRTPTDAIALQISVFLFVELWEVLDRYLPDVSAVIQAATPNPTFSGDQAQAKADLVQYLRNQTVQNKLTLADALKGVADKYADLNKPGADPNTLNFGKDYNLKSGSSLDKTALATLRDKFKAALSTDLPPIELPKFDPGANAQYILRHVYERPECAPVQQIVSRPSPTFCLAPFFDPDAPARPIRIPLPTDVSIASLRKFKKGVSIMMSEAMAKKMNSIGGKEQALLDGSASLSDPSGGIALICSFSIQIIFIVAFFLLLIFVFVFNIIFWWIAFFRICLPVPKELIPD